MLQFIFLSYFQIIDDFLPLLSGLNYDKIVENSTTLFQQVVGTMTSKPEVGIW